MLCTKQLKFQNPNSNKIGPIKVIGRLQENVFVALWLQQSNVNTNLSHCLYQGKLIEFISQFLFQSAFRISKLIMCQKLCKRSFMHYLRSYFSLSLNYCTSKRYILQKLTRKSFIVPCKTSVFALAGRNYSCSSDLLHNT